LLLGGEACSADVVDEWAPGRVLINAYGPTEATVYASLSAPLEPGTGAARSALLFRRRRLFVLDKWLQPVPEGVVGELYVTAAAWRWAISANGVDRITLSWPRRSASPEPGCIAPGTWCAGVPTDSCNMSAAPTSRSRFAAIASSPVRFQAALAALDGVEQGGGDRREDRPGDQRLVGYITGATDPAVARLALADQLPSYMVPAAVVRIEALPLTVNGKLDVRALPAPEYQDGEQYRAPTNLTEEILAGIYAQILGVERVGVDDSFFDRGGDSLSAMRVIAGVNAALDAGLSVRVLFEAPTVAQLALRVGGEWAASSRWWRGSGPMWSHCRSPRAGCGSSTSSRVPHPSTTSRRPAAERAAGIPKRSVRHWLTWCSGRKPTHAVPGGRRGCHTSLVVPAAGADFGWAVVRCRGWSDDRITEAIDGWHVTNSIWRPRFRLQAGFSALTPTIMCWSPWYITLPPTAVRSPRWCTT